MAYIRDFNSPPAIIIADAGMLMGEVLRSSRGPRITSLLWALHTRRAVLILPRHVLEEVERNLPRRAVAGDNLDLAYQRLRTLYLARARIVDVPPDWGAGDPRVHAITLRHPTDAPAAQLAVTLGYCFLLTEDPDLHEIPGLGFAAWLEVAHATANETETRGIYLTAKVPAALTTAMVESAARRIAAAPPAVKWTLVGVTGVLVAVAIWFVHSGKADRLIERAKPVIDGAKELAQTYGPPIMETLQRQVDGQLALSRAAVPPANPGTLAGRIAQILAITPEPQLAGDIARNLQIPGTLKDRTRAVRQELNRHEGAFVQITRGRWMLGHLSGYQPAPLSPAEILDYKQRLHKKARIQPDTR